MTEVASTLAALADRYWEQVSRFKPTESFLRGDHRFAGEMEDRSRAAEDEAIADLGTIAASAEALDPGSLSRGDPERAGRSTRDASVTKWACFRGIWSGRESSPSTRGGRVGWWSIRGCTPLVGHVRKLSTTCWPTHHWRPTTSSTRSSATSAGPDRRLPTRPGSRRSCDSGMRHGPPSVPPSTLRAFHDVVLGSGGVTLPVLRSLIEE
jgi:hypothetical protein